MRLGIDIMGGDYAPEQTTLGAIQAHKELPGNAELFLFGDQSQIEKILIRENADPRAFTIVL